jgi:hypothetical protein
MKSLVRPLMILACATVGTVALWLAVPAFVSFALETWLHHRGYQDVFITIDSPGWRSLTIPEVRIGRTLTGERVTVTLNKSVMEYSLAGLLRGQCDRMVLPDVSIVVDGVASSAGDHTTIEEVDLSDGSMPLWNILTVSDLVQRLPAMPFAELQLGRLTIFRDQATGPLREIVASGSVRQRVEGFTAELVLQGTGTQSYRLQVSDLATHVLVVQLETKDTLPKTITHWRSEAVPGEVTTQLRGMVDVYAQELAPFLALILPIGAEWQRVTGRVQASWEGTAPSDIPLKEVWRDARAQVQGAVRLGVTLPEWKGVGKDLTVMINGTFVGNTEKVQWTIRPGTWFSANTDAQKIPALKPIRADLPPGFQPLQIGSAADVSGDLLWAESPTQFSIEGPLVMTYGETASRLRLELTAQQMMGRGSMVSHADGTFHLGGALPRALGEALGAKQVTGDLRGSLSLKDDQLGGIINAPSSIIASEAQHSSVTMDSAVIAVSDAIPFRFNFHSQEWRVESSTITIRPHNIRTKQAQAGVQQAQLQLQSAGGTSAVWNAQGVLTVQGISLIQPDMRWPSADWAIRFTADQAAMRAEVQAKLQASPVIVAAEIQHDRKAQRGSLHGTTNPVTFDRTSFRLRQLMTPWSYPFDVTEGTLSASFDLAWEPDAQDPAHGLVVRSGSGELTLDRLTAQYRETAITGLSTTLSVKTNGRDRLETTRPAAVTIASVNPGVAVTNLSITVQGEWDAREPLPIIEVRDVRCELLGAVVTSQGARADLARPPYSLSLLVRQLDLRQVLNLEQQKGLEGSGLLDGSIPITKTATGMVVNDGLFEARPPGGVIRYETSPEAAKTMMQANANLQLVLNALSNFHYTVLQVETQYAEDGLLHLKVRLEGKNPDMKNSPPIHFNLTVQENIPALLKSLRLVRDIEESVQKRFVKP